MNAKKIFFLLSFGAISFISFGQELQRYIHTSLNFSQTDPVMGTARYSAMGGAMGALGADASAMKDNPAGMGVYRKWDISFTPNVYVDNDGKVGFDVNNFGLVMNFGNSGNKKGYITSSLGVSYNRLKNFNRNTVISYNQDYSRLQSIYNWRNANDYNNNVFSDATDLGLLDTLGNSPFHRGGERIDNQTIYTEEGSMGEWNFSYGMNISNKIYIGASIGIVDLDYKMTATYNEWNENNDNWGLINYYEATGSGVNFKIGAIAAPVDFLRIGFAFHTPTFLNLRESWLPNDISYNNEYAFNEDDKWDQDGEFDKSKLQTPLELQGSLGFILGKRALIGVEYQFANYKAMRTSDDNGNLFGEEKKLISNQMNYSHTAKIGAEVKILDELAVRGGFAFVSPSIHKMSQSMYSEGDINYQTYPLTEPKNIFYYTAGVGYKGKYFYADLAYVHQIRKESFFESLPLNNGDSPENLSLTNNNIMATIGFRF